ncbi:polysaccharide biosynthesis tyrosine autokinase [Roseivivax sp. THAF197b]|uniref:polysaccharide biosynthesis tyrosine autokinase n=1 Tax=Roseivivax sp. THAF197b TaxID=2588299 RepID=UPI0012A8BF05|nr:polysaccharide biosynthesis tyrosine autokinase [Roseivivax sp. THAF197b]QFS84797.1 Tyrosine-protein kinase etk [Roseivivax sp. THAF197b]
MNTSISQPIARSGVPAPQTDTQDDEIDLMELAGTLWRGKWIIALCAVVAVLIGGAYAYLVAVPKYQASTTLAIELQIAPIVDIEAVVSGTSTEDASLNTELEVIRSRGLLLQLVDEMDLLNDPEFNASLRPEPVLSLEPVKQVVRNLIGAGEKEGPDAETIRNRTVAAVRNAISASVIRDTYVFNISMRTEDAVKSQRLVNTLAQIYIGDQVAKKFQTTENAVTWLSERVTELEAELLEREDDLQAARTETDLISPEALEALNRQLIDLRNRLGETRAQIALQEQRTEQYRELLDSDDFETLAMRLSDPTLNRLRPDVLERDGNATQLFESRADLLISREETNLERLRSQETALAASLERQETDLAEQSEDLAGLEQRERELESVRTLYETFLNRLKEASVQRGLQQADSRVLSTATPGEYVEPRKSLILALSGILGVMLGAAIILGRQFMHSGFRTADDLEAHTGQTILGQIPKMPIKRRDQLIDYLNAKPTSAAAEAIRNLRTSVLLSNVDEPPQVIMSTSSLPGEGKTTQAISLSHNLAGMGRKVLLIEADIRRRTFQQYFKVDENHPGLVAAMMEECTVEEAVIRDPRMPVDILMGDKSNLNAADIFSSEKFKEFLKRLRGMYDIIIIDTPPVLVVPDARVIGQYTDAIIFTTAWDRTTKAQVREAMRQFATANLRVSGLVLGQIDPKGMKRYGYGGKYGAYSAYGSGYYNS